MFADGVEVGGKSPMVTAAVKASPAPTVSTTSVGTPEWTALPSRPTSSEPLLPLVRTANVRPYRSNKPFMTHFSLPGMAKRRATTGNSSSFSFSTSQFRRPSSRISALK